MFARFIAVAFALVTAPSALAQQTSPQPAPPKPPLPLFYVSAGFAWSQEFGAEVEAGIQTEVGDAVRLRFSPANIALMDGDVPRGFHWSGPNQGRDCYDTSNTMVIDEYCAAEPDTEWRSVLEAQVKLAPGFHFGGGATYLLQGDFRPQDGRVATFASLSWDGDDGMGIELRAGSEYVALSIRGLW